jgi:hypothetical protein
VSLSAIAHPPVRAVDSDLLSAAIGRASPITAGAPLVTSLGAGERGLCRFALQPNRAAGRVENLH